MLEEVILEERLNKLEKAVSEIQNRLENKSSEDNWLEKLTGSISDEEAFLEALKYGRAVREAEMISHENNT